MILAKLLLYGFAITLPYQPAASISNGKKVEKNGMAFEWQIEGAILKCKVSAPGTGWVAIGFNPENELSGTNLIMGSVAGKDCTISDRFIVQPGLHQAISELGGREQLLDPKGVEVDGNTILEFSMPLNSSDVYHHTLKAGQGYHLLLAYSRDDDFQHHSIMRTSVFITL